MRQHCGGVQIQLRLHEFVPRASHKLANLLNNMFLHSNVDHNDMFPIAATRWQVLIEVRFDLTRAGAEFLWQHTHAGTRGTLKLMVRDEEVHRTTDCGGLQ